MIARLNQGRPILSNRLSADIRREIMEEVICVRGVSGAGKSSWIKDNIIMEDTEICTADDYHVNDKGEYEFTRENAGNAHNKCLRKFAGLVHLHHMTGMGPKRVVVDNTNMRMAELAPYVALARAYGIRVRIVHIKCDIKKAAARNLHGVPEATVEYMAEHCEDCPPWWDEEIVEN